MTSYADLKLAIERNAVRSFDDFFLFITHKQFMKDMGISQRRLKALKQLPMGMTMGELDRLAELIGVNPGAIGVILRGDHIARDK